MPFELPLVPSVPNYRVQTVLGETPYVFDLRWNGREGLWHMDLLQTDGTPIAYGLAVVLDSIWIRGVNLAGRPANFGLLVTVDTSGQRRDAGLDDLGTRVRVYWYSPDEIREALNA